MYKEYFPEEDIEFNDIYYICYMLEYVARMRHLQNFEVLNCISKEQLYHLLSCADVLHCENPNKIANEWIRDYSIPEGDFHFDAVDPELEVNIPSETRIGKVFAKIISEVVVNTIDDDLLGTFYNVYNSPITKKINDYNCSAFYEPSYYQVRAYYNGHF